jgi:hypothetical protein
MDYVTKKEFETALSVLERALRNSQVEERRETFELPVHRLLFAIGQTNEYLLAPNQVSFIAPDLAAKNRLYSLRNELKLSREDVAKNQKTLEQLEKEEKTLVALVPTLKE